MKKGLSILLVMGMLLTLTAIPSFADEGEKQKPNPDVGVMLQEDPEAPAEVEPEEAKKQKESRKNDAKPKNPAKKKNRSGDAR